MTTFALLAALLPSLTASSKIFFYIGTYTSPSGSKGIYGAALDTQSGKISDAQLLTECSNPSYLALSPGGNNLYAVHENDRGSVSAYKIGPHHRLTALNEQSLSGGAPCDLSVDPTGKYLLTASYTGGMVASLPILPDGGVGKPATEWQNTGQGPNRDRQEASHMHWVDVTAGSRFMYTCDLGTDRVQVYRFDPKSGAFSPLVAETGSVPPGSGPRHGAFNPDQTILYVNNEMGNSVSAFHVDHNTGALRLFQTTPTLSKEALDHESASHMTTTAEIEFHPNAKWLYVSNRGHNSITRFQIAPDGTIAREQVTHLEVKMPRGFAIDPSGHWLIVGGQDSNDLACYSIDQTSGQLKLRSHWQGIGKPVCILFPSERN